MKDARRIEFWSVENTGWSGGISWFSTGGSETNPLRFKSEDEAMEYAITCKNELDQDSTKWRVVKTCITSTEWDEMIYREYNFL